MSRQAKKGIDDLNTIFPSLASEWHPTLNLPLQPDDVLPGSNRKVYWKCKKCGYEWQATIANRAKLGRGCPCCANKVVVKGINDFATTHPEIAKEWYQPLNGATTPAEITYGCGKKFSWICPRGHIYSATVLHRTNGVGTKCPVCNSGRQTSFSEQAIFFYVKQLYPDAINSFRDIFEKGMELDIYIPDLRLGIEYDGIYWHHNKTTAAEREKRKYDICKEHNIILLRVRERRHKDDVSISADKVIYLPNHKFESEALNQAINEVLIYINAIADDADLKQPTIDVNKDKFDILKYLSGPVKNSVQEKAPHLVSEWDYTKNGNLTPEMIASGSSLSVNWICSTCGYKWEAGIYHRVKEHTGCPKCAGLVFEEGINDLQTKRPELLIDWDYTENAAHNIYPNKIQYNSGTKVFWKCHKCGYKWAISLNSRTTNGNGCIQCGYVAGKLLKQQNLLNKQGCINDPLLLKEWDYAKNSLIGLFPDKLVAGSNKSAYWICSTCGYEWKAPIARRSKGAGCRKCADKTNPTLIRKTLREKGHELDNPLLIQEWDYDKNIHEPSEYTFGSKEKVYWICSKCNYSWQATIYSRNKGAGCPACAGHISVSGKNDLATLRPDIAKEWDYQKNTDVIPSQVSYSSGHKFWWICPNGHDSYLATPSHRVNGTNCPICAKKIIGEKASKPVDQYSLDGVYIKTFKSLKEASVECNVSHGAICNAIRKSSTSAGYRWKYHI